jgi:nucleotide-binding universal stress UspA family protein
MRVLIVYDGSEVAEAELHELQKAGLSGRSEVLLLSVVETWSSLEKAKEIEKLALQTQEHLRQEFPFWQIISETVYGNPAREILTKAEGFKPDLIVVGEPRQTLAERNIFLGNISQKVLTEAQCSVRIARGKREIDPTASRIVIGFDGSDGAQTAIEAVASRFWRCRSEVKLVVVNDASVMSPAGQFVSAAGNLPGEVKLLRKLMEQSAEIPLQKLKNAGLTPTLCIESGNPKDVLIELAEKWQADSIFVGPNCGGNSFDRFLLGSVSAAIAARAHCSVEISRNKSRKS